MSSVTRKTIVGLALLIGVAVVAAGGLVWSGVYDVGADDPHWRSTYALLETVRERSIETRAGKLQVPANLGDPARIRQGAGNYAAMCAGCHLAPGVAGTEMSKGLYPAPPALARNAVEPAHAFWVIKHGIKGTGMPAWGLSMDDEYIWNMAAFLQELPKLDAARYQALVESSEGHSHGGGETQQREEAGVEGDHHDEAPAKQAKPHSHAPGTPPHDDSAAAAKVDTIPSDAAEQEADDEHEHQH